MLLHISTTFIHGTVRAAVGGLWHVAVFFLIGGFFVKEKKCFVRGKFFSLYIPSMFCYIIAAIFHNFFVKYGLYPLGMPSPSDGKPFSLWDDGQYLIGLLKAVIGFGEPVMGAMWFVYVLLFSHICLWVLRKFITNELLLLLLLFVIQWISWTMTYFEVTIPRINNTMSVMMLIELGRLVWKFREKRNYSSTFVGVLLPISIAVSIFGVIYIGNISLNKNFYHDPISLDIVSMSVLFLLLRFSSIVAKTCFANILSYLGRHSFAIMAGHILGFYVLTSIISSFFGIFFVCRNTILVDVKHWYLVIAYLIMGVVVPLAIAWIVERLKIKIYGK